MKRVKAHLSFWAPYLASTGCLALMCGASGGALAAGVYYTCDMIFESHWAVSISLACIAGLLLSAPIFATCYTPYHDQIFFFPMRSQEWVKYSEYELREKATGFIIANNPPFGDDKESRDKFEEKVEARFKMYRRQQWGEKDILDPGEPEPTYNPVNAKKAHAWQHMVTTRCAKSRYEVYHDAVRST